MRKDYDVCPLCATAIANMEYNGMFLCEECYIRTKMRRNNISNTLMEDNTFIVTKSEEQHVGVITGYQHRMGRNEDKFYIYLNVNGENFSIWYDGWQTEKELAKICDKYKINIPKLLK